ncbi:MAG: nucleotide pyrophosphohydrolase [Patescibacteria group bacterium]|nr:nucleotide pyrophosphohydrolase [Patescibacteria group bacterium]MCL5095579.1 nucleotide pyrophosphohydrolase [Patescibacteria group bacterium]
MSDIKKLTEEVVKFRNERKWQQFHKPKDMAISLALEAAEVLEHFQWKTEEEVEQYLKNHREHIADELSDVLWWVLLMSHDLEIDIYEAFLRKKKKNEEKYPIEKSRGTHQKYTEL